jgi:hypothetical protein
MDLVAFLKARLDEDEAEIAKHPADGGSPDWDLVATVEMNYPCLPYISIGPERARAEIEAKRLIVDECDVTIKRGDSDDGLASIVLRALAEPYADQAEYKDEWRVTA